MTKNNKPQYYDHAISVAVAKEAKRLVEQEIEKIEGKLRQEMRKIAEKHIKDNPDILEGNNEVSVITMNANPDQQRLYNTIQALSLFARVIGFQASGIPLNYILASASEPELQIAVVQHSENPSKSDIDDAFAKKGIDPDILVFSKTDGAKAFFTFKAWKGIKSLWDDVTSKVPEGKIDKSVAKIIDRAMKDLGERPLVEAGVDFEVPKQVKATHRPSGKHMH